ncbi:glycosyltransferase [Halocatena halophila]|uniref:glycosyltransferase n=1 Tax=Halocatena halophila TaxID=2814576 RepID=UPI002ED53D12
MELSVVVPTLNGREHLVHCLDALSLHAPAAEIIVVNGPSVDGTTGMVRRRDDVDVLVEIGDRNVNVARNAGLDRATGTVVAFVDYWVCIEPSWVTAIEQTLDRPGIAHRESGHGRPVAGAITGPIHHPHRHEQRQHADRRTIDGQSVTYFDGGNVAFRRKALAALDGFDEYLVTGGARDCAHRLARLGYTVAYDHRLCVTHQRSTPHSAKTTESLGFRPQDPKATSGERDWNWRYRSLTYRLVKNYGPSSLWRVGRHAVGDGVDATLAIARGTRRPSDWVDSSKSMINGTATGLRDGMLARLRDRTPRRNHNGRSKRADRAVAVYDERE